MKTVAGPFSSMAQAEQVTQSLRSEEYSAKAIANGTGVAAGATEGEGVGQKISTFSMV